MQLKTVLLIAMTTMASSVVSAQQAPPPATSGMTIAQAVDAALRHYPSIAVSQEQIKAAAAGIDLAQNAYLPRVDSLIQINRATRNNVFGLLTPQSVIPSISGPVLGTSGFESVWGSAAGALVTWEPFDFGLRGAGKSAAEAAKARSTASLARSELDVSVAAADAYLTLIAAQDTQRAAQAGVDRAEVLVRSVRARVDAQIRPGADASRAEAELAVARAQLARANQATEMARAILAQFVGIEPSQISIASEKFLELPPEMSAPAANAAQHPAVAEQSAVIQQKKAELHALEKSYVPRFYAQGSLFARGTGAEIDGTRLSGLNGLAPSAPNYALGFSITFPVLDFASVHAREAAQSAAIRAETARSQLINTDLTAQRNAAAAALEGSRRVATYTPIEVSSAIEANQQAAARYQSGLGTIVEVADTQRLLTQGQIDDALARLSVWRALLGTAAAAGDIQPFLSASQ